MVLRDFQERREMKKILFSLPTILLAVSLVALSFYGVFRAYSARLEIRREIAKLERQIDESKKATVDFKEKFSKLNTPQGLEKEARGRFNLRMPGEKLVVFIDDDFEAASANSFSGRLWNFWEAFKKFLFFNF